MSRRTKTQLVVLAFAGFAMGTEAYVYVGHLGALANELEIGIPEAGLLAASFAVTYALTAPILAALLARMDRRTMIVIGLAAIGAFDIAASLAPSFLLLVALRIPCGLASGLVGPPSSAMAAALAPPERRGRAMAVVLAGMTLAFILGIPAGSLVGAVGGWRATFAFAGLLALVAAAAALIILPSVPGTPSVGPGALRLALRPELAPTLALTCIGFAATFTVIAYIAPIALVIAGIEGAGVGALQSLIGVGSIIGIAIGARYADHSSAMLMVLVSFGVSAVALATYSGLTWLGSDHPGTLPALSLAMVGGAAALFARSATIQTRLVNLEPASSSVLLALNGSLVFAGQGLGAIAGAAIGAAFGTASLGFAGAVIAVSGMLLSGWVLCRSRSL